MRVTGKRRFLAPGAALLRKSARPKCRPATPSTNPSPVTAPIPDPITDPERVPLRLGVPERAPDARLPAPLNAGDYRSSLGLTDAAVVDAWLAEYARAANTQRAYRREAGRFLRWLGEIRGARLADLGRLDFDDYRAFLAEPPDDWVLTGRATGRFRAGLSPASQRQALLILQSLLDYLVAGDYLRKNPLRLMKDKGPTPGKRVRPVPTSDAITRALALLDQRLDPRPDAPATGSPPLAATAPHGARSLDASSAVLPANLPDADRDAAARAALAFGWLYWTACRRAELAAARLGDLQPESAAPGARWWWQLTGKGEVAARLPVGAEALALLLRVGRFDSPRALADYLRRTPDAPLMSLGQTSAATSVSAIYEGLRAAAGWVAAHPALADLDDADRALLAELRPHALRRARCTHLLDAGVEPRLVQRFLRHASIDTTLIYDQTGERDFHDALTGTVGAAR